MIRKFFVFTALIVLVAPSICFLACGDCIGCGPNYEPEYYATDYKWYTNSVNGSVTYDHYKITAEPIIVKQSVAMSIGLISNAYASSPHSSKKDVVEKIEIIAHQDYDATHLAGDDLSELFLVNGEDIGESIIIDYRVDRLVLTPKSPPAQDNMFNFTVKLYIDGKQVDYSEFTTPMVEIKK